ncbi:MAG: hypothetical protein WBO10_09070 [Pyrinomonadaceae bacterium]
MLKQAIIICAVIFSVAGIAVGQSVYTREKSSTERKAILDALRVPVEREMRQKIIFVVDNFKIQGNWAFVSGTPQNSTGGPPDLSITRRNEGEDMFDDNFFGLLKRTGGKWKVVTHALGCTDVCYANWWKKYRAPKAIFPYTE